MPLAPGTRIGSYDLISAIGAGGMGEVYRARDSKLHRDVAIKVLPDLFAADADRLMRFEREAQTLAALNHPNIAQVFGVLETPPASTAIVMELVEGRSLDEVIHEARQAGAGLPLSDCLAIAPQIADGLEAAHDRGIVHRDLKPANIKVRNDGTVKLLDFGLAKDVNGGVASSRAEAATLTSPAATQMGVILGTAAYMAPEQARGRPVDRRADIWAFGCVLYEMLTGRALFRSDDVSMTLAAILTQPVDFDSLPAATPPPVRRLLRRCLEREPRNRLSSMADARLELQDAAAEPSPSRVPTAAHSIAPILWAIGGAALSVTALIGFMEWGPRYEAEHTAVRSDITFKTPLRLSGNRAFALNPAGSEIILVGETDAERFDLYRRRLDQQEAVLIPGTEGAQEPFFSPDGLWLGFVQQGRLKKMPVAGGAAIDLGPAAGMQGAAFAPDGSIVLNPRHGEGLERVAATAAERTSLTKVDRAKGEAGHHWPHILPDGKHLLYTVEIDGKPYSEARIMLLSLETGEQRPLVEGGSDARYLPTGHIVYWRENSVWRAPFDRSRLQVTGPGAPILTDVMLGEPNGQAYFSVSDGGTLIYLSGTDAQGQRALMRVDRSGVGRQLGDRRAFETVSVSPDGTRVAVTIIAANDSLWLTELDRPSFTRITYEAENSRAIWSPDGTRIALARHRGGEPRQLYLMPADGATTPAILRESAQGESPDSWSAANLLAYTRNEPSAQDVWVLDMNTGEAKPVLATRFAEVHPRFSADGKWLAYASDESGRFEVYVRPYPGPGQKRLVSSNGGTEPRWRGDGRELFYRIGDAVMSVEVTFTPQIRTSIPRLMFRGAYRAEVGWPTWDVLPSGQAFLLIQDLAGPRTTIHMVQHWFAELR